MIDAATGIEYGFIYKITNKSNGKIYIGQTITKLKRRWDGHCGDARKGKRRWLPLAIAKYGPENFLVQPLVYAPESVLNSLESKCIERFDSMRKGYNMRMDGSRISPEVRKRMSEAQKGKPSPKRGVPLSKEQANSLREVNVGRKASEETKAKMRASFLRNLAANPDRYKKTPEQKEAARVKQLGKKAAPGVGAKISAANKGRVFSDEARANMSAAQKGKTIRPDSLTWGNKYAAGNTTRRGTKHTEETKLKMSNSQRNRKKKTRVIEVS